MDVRYELMFIDNFNLLPCPFCGFTPNAKYEDCIYPATRDRSVWQLVCYSHGGGCDASVLGDSPQDCIKKWNTRTPEEL